jgi:hypothetical protein
VAILQDLADSNKKARSIYLGNSINHNFGA